MSNSSGIPSSPPRQSGSAGRPEPHPDAGKSKVQEGAGKSSPRTSEDDPNRGALPKFGGSPVATNFGSALMPGGGPPPSHNHVGRAPAPSAPSEVSVVRGDGKASETPKPNKWKKRLTPSISNIGLAYYGLFLGGAVGILCGIAFGPVGMLAGAAVGAALGGGLGYCFGYILGVGTTQVAQDGQGSGTSNHNTSSNNASQESAGGGGESTSVKINRTDDSPSSVQIDRTDDGSASVQVTAMPRGDASATQQGNEEAARRGLERFVSATRDRMQSESAKRHGDGKPTK